MSYILEALKRAEQERKLGRAPDPLVEVAAPTPVALPPSRRPLLIGAGAVVLLVGLAYAGYRWFGSDGKTEAPVAAQTPPTTPPLPETTAAAEPAAAEAAPAEATPAAGDAKIADGQQIATLDDLAPDQGDNDPADPPEDSAEGEPHAGDGSGENQDEANGAVAAQPAYTPPPPAPRAAPQPAPARQAAAPAPGPAPTLVFANPATRTPPPAASAPAPKPRTATPAPSAARARTSAASAETVITIPAENGSAAVAAVPAPASSPAAAPAPAAPAPATAAPAAAPPPAAPTRDDRLDSLRRLDALRRFKEMPPAYRAQFPAFSVDVHVYNADPARSFVLINGKRYRGGDTIAEGPRIDEIVSEGIVFEWRGEKVLYVIGR